MLGFPFWKLGFSHLVNFELNVLRPYENWNEDLKVLAGRSATPHRALILPR